MTTIERQTEEREKIIKGLKLAFERLIEFKKSKNSDLIVMVNNKIVRIDPHKITSPDMDLSTLVPEESDLP